jgi:hypothetical protein
MLGGHPDNALIAVRAGVLCCCRYGRHSYSEVMLQPLAQALNAAGWRPQTRVWFAMQGEMSATVVRFPKSYTQLVPQLRAVVCGGDC